MDKYMYGKKARRVYAKMHIAVTGDSYFPFLYFWIFLQWTSIIYVFFKF